MVIVGNKSDLRFDHRHVPTEDGRKLAKGFNCSSTGTQFDTDFHKYQVKEARKATASVVTSNNNKTLTLTATYMEWVCKHH